MPTSTFKARIVRVERRAGKAGLVVATSPDLTGLLVTELDWDSLNTAIPGAIREMYAACGVDVVVTPVEDTEDPREAWVALPRQALALAEAH